MLPYNENRSYGCNVNRMFCSIIVMYCRIEQLHNFPCQMGNRKTMTKQLNTLLGMHIYTVMSKKKNNDLDCTASMMNDINEWTFSFAGKENSIHEYTKVAVSYNGGET